MKFIVRALMVLAVGFAVACEKKNPDTNDPDKKMTAAYSAANRMDDISQELKLSHIYLSDPTTSDTALADLDTTTLDHVKGLLEEYLAKAKIVMASYRIDEVQLKKFLQTLINDATKIHDDTVAKMQAPGSKSKPSINL